MVVPFRFASRSQASSRLLFLLDFWIAQIALIPRRNVDALSLRGAVKSSEFSHTVSAMAEFNAVL
jgi:hypothetical protein